MCIVIEYQFKWKIESLQIVHSTWVFFFIMYIKVALLDNQLLKEKLYSYVYNYIDTFHKIKMKIGSFTCCNICCNRI